MLAAKILNKRFFAAIRNELFPLNKFITLYIKEFDLIICNNTRSLNGLKAIDYIKTNYFIWQMVSIPLCLNQR